MYLALQFYCICDIVITNDLSILILGSPGTGINPTDVAQLMQNINMSAAKSTSISTVRKSSSGFNYSHRFDDRDDSDDDSEDDDEELDDEDLDEDASETDTNNRDKASNWSDKKGNSRRSANMASDIEQIRNRFGETNVEDVTENDSGGNTTGDDVIELPAITKKVEINLDANYQNFEFDEDIDSENLITDEEDDNESGFLSQI